MQSVRIQPGYSFRRAGIGAPDRGGSRSALTVAGFWILAAVLLAGSGFAPAAHAQTATTCSPAASAGVNGPVAYTSYCWIDFTGYNAALATSAGGQAFVVTMPGGSTLSFTLNVSGGALAGVAVPTWTGAAMGHSAFLNIPGNPALYQTANGTTTNVSLSNLVLTVGSGPAPYAIVAADAESTNQNESLSFTTNGSPWTLLASMAYQGSANFPTLSGCSGTTPGSTCAATVTETGVAGNVGAYAFQTQNNPTTVSSVLVGGGLQGAAFAVQFRGVDLGVTSSHSGNFGAGNSGTYTLSVVNNGPNTFPAADTITVQDTLPAGLSYASASGSGWSCSASGQLVTCTTTANPAVGATLPAITLNVNVLATAPSTVTNTVTVASNPNLDFYLVNNTSNDSTTIVYPDLSTSSKTVTDTSGPNYLVGDTLQYTLTLTESAGVTTNNASVTDNVPANLSNFTVTSIPSGANNSSTAGGGANGDGYLNVTGITVPANGSVSVVFTARVAAGTANCTQINNTATVTNPYGNGASPAAPTVTVAQSSCVSSGNKILYVYDNSTLTRTPQATNTTTAVTVGPGASNTWALTPAIATGKSLVLPAGNVSVTLIEQATNRSTGSARPTTVTLLNNGAAVATSGTVNVGTANAYLYTITIPATTVAAGATLGVQVNNNDGGNRHDIAVSQKTTLGSSMVSFLTTTVINVDSITAYSATYPSTSTVPIFVPNNTVYICAVVSDPFGSYDVDPTTGGTAPQITLTDPNNTVQVNAAAMTRNGSGGTDCSGTANAAASSFEYTYTVPNTAQVGAWKASVTGWEGTEHTVKNTGIGSFAVQAPSLLIMKSVMITSDPVEGTTRPKALPGATAQYTITVQNNGAGPVDNNTMVITDPVPANTILSLPASPPFTFTDGSPSSGLTVASGDGSIAYSNNGGTSYTYVPTCTRPCTDSAITNFQITLNGSMNAKTAAAAPSFTLSFNVVIK